MEEVIPPELRDRVLVYMDDLLVMSEDFESHLSLLKEVALLIRKAGLTLNIDKSNFCLKEVEFVGYIIGYGTIQTNPGKVAAITDYPVPKTVRQVRRFLGMTGWYRRFIRNFASLTAPISDLLKKNKTFKWTEEANEAFKTLKTKLTTAPVLTTPDFSKPFCIQCDASSVGIGGVLTQANEVGEEMPIAFVSQKLSTTQQKYNVTEKECLAAIKCLEKFRPYVEGHEFKIITDHASLKWLMSQKNLSTRLAHWSLKIQGYNFTFEHRKGTDNVVPDALSRVDMVDSITISFEIDLDSPHFESTEYKNLIKAIEENQQHTKNLLVENGLVFKKIQESDLLPGDVEWRLWIPQAMADELIENTHNSVAGMHGGIKKTLEAISQKFYWPNMARQIGDFIRNCEVCKQTKPPNFIQRPPMGNMAVSERSMQRFYIDLIGPFPRSKKGHIGILIILDHFSKFPFLYTLKIFKAEKIIEKLEEVFSFGGVPETIVSDNGTQFKAIIFENFLKKYGVEHVFTALYSPQANASERVNRSIICGIRAYLNEDQRNWDLHLTSITMALRSSYHQSIGCSPYFALFGQEMMLHGKSYKILRKLNSLSTGENISHPARMELIRQKLQDKIRKAYEANEKLYNLRCNREAVFKEGEEVYRQNFKQSHKAENYNAKLDKRSIKSRVVKRIGNNQYLLADMQGKEIGIFHAKDLHR